MHCAHTRCSSAVTAVSRRPGGQNNKKKKERKIKYNNIIIYLLDRLPDAYNCVMVTTCTVRSLGARATANRPDDEHTSPRDFYSNSARKRPRKFDGARHGKVKNQMKIVDRRRRRVGERAGREKTCFWNEFSVRLPTIPLALFLLRSREIETKSFQITIEKRTNKTS